MKGLFKKVLATVLVSTMIIAMDQNVNVKSAVAAEIYISVEDYSKAISNEINIAAVNDSYAEGLKAAGIIGEGEFTSYDENITRGDALVILSRADEYLNGTQVSSELVQTAIDKRISDIGKVAEGKIVDIAKAYLKGFMKGYSNGVYCTDRNLKVTKKITKEGALSCIAMLKDNSKRAKISPDGQLIRTTNLPKNAKTYPYILASYPNAYYEKDRVFEGITEYDMNGNLIIYKSGLDYFNPVDIEKFAPSWYKSDFTKDRELLNDNWVAKAVSHVNHVFNVDYHIIDDKWVDDMINLSTYYGSVHSEWYQDRLDSYVKNMKEAQTIVKASKVIADSSSLYYFDKKFYVRVYVRYKVVSTKIAPNIDVETFIIENPFKSVLFSTQIVDMRNFKQGEWVDGYFDVGLTYYSELNDLLGVSIMNIDLNE